MVFNFAELNFPQGRPFLHLIWPQKEHGPDNSLGGKTIRKLTLQQCKRVKGSPRNNDITSTSKYKMMPEIILLSN